MSKKTEISNQKTGFGNTRSKALNHTRTTWKVNMQKVKILDEGNNKKTIYLSSRELKTFKKTGILPNGAKAKLAFTGPKENVSVNKKESL